MSPEQPGSAATVENLLAQMSRAASVLSGWDAVLNIDEDLVNRIFQVQFEQSARQDWKNITIAFCQLFPNPAGSGKLAAYTGVEIALATPSLRFLGDNQAFVEVSFTATGRTGSASKVVSASFDPKSDCDPNDPGLDWTYTSFSATAFTGTVPLSAVTGSSRTSGGVTEFVLDFSSGSFTSPAFARVKDPDTLQLQLRQYLQSHDVQYVISSIRTDLVDQMPQMAPKAFRIAALTTNQKKNVFQIFIATQHPPQLNLAIGVNEPIPDGYDLSVMFNAAIAGQLHTSLMVQAWLFMGSNLVFPGRTTLSLGPSFTPNDALILGTVAVDASSPISPVEPRTPAEEGPMLNIQKTKQITPAGQPAFTAYGDDTDPNAWYIPPKVVWARDPATNLPQFSLTQYNSTGGTVSGFCRFSVQLMIDPVQLAALRAAVPGATTPQFDWIQSGAIFTYTIAGKSTSIRSRPSNFGSQVATFSVPLEDAVAIAAFVNAFSPSGSGGGTFGISYDLAANTRLPAVTVVSTFNSTIAYQYQVENRFRTETKYHTDTWGNSSSSVVQVFVGTFVKEMLQQSQAGTIVVTPGTGLTPTLLTMVEDWAKIQLQKDVEEAVTSALALTRNPTNNLSMNAVASFTRTLQTSNVVPWYFTVDGTLPPFDANTWNQLHSAVNQQQLEVTFDIQADLAANGIDRVNLTFQYGDPPPKTHTFDAGQEAPWYVTLPGQFDGTTFKADYKYKYEVIYAKPARGAAPPPLSTDWISGNSTSVELGAVQLGLLPVSFEASNIGWAGSQSKQGTPAVKEITVDWNWIPGDGGAVLSESLVLNSQRPSVTSTLRSTGPTDNQQYQYSLTFLMDDGTKLHVVGLTGTSPRQRIDHPLSEMSVDVMPFFPTDATAVILRATFYDEQNDIHLSNEWRARATSKGHGAPVLDTGSFQPWTFQAVIANLNMATVVFSGVWVDAKAKQHAIPKTIVVGTNNTLIISDTQRVVTAVIDASNVAFAQAQEDGVYRVAALVADSESTAGDGTADPLANARTIAFGRDTPSVQYYQTDPIDLAATPTFHYQYVYTVNTNKGANTKVVNNWAQPQSTVSTALPVVPGQPAAVPQAMPREALAVAAAPHRAPALDARTRALLARHDSFCESSVADLASLLKDFSPSA